MTKKRKLVPASPGRPRKRAIGEKRPRFGVYLACTSQEQENAIKSLIETYGDELAKLWGSRVTITDTVLASLMVLHEQDKIKWPHRGEVTHG